jgi:uncharacterized membrane protein (DUF4010 family)
LPVIRVTTILRGTMPPLLVAIVASACLGALVGLIRQWSDQTVKTGEPDLGGVRTFTFWGMLGCVGAFASDQTSPFLLGVLILLVGAQQIAVRLQPAAIAKPGGTTFASALLTMLAGCLVYWEQRPAAVLVAATTMVLIGSKQSLHAWTRAFTRQDIRGTLQFVAITGVILPLVPNRDIGPFQAFNPFSTWLMVVLISGLGFAGYIAMRMLGAGAGIVATSLLGGLASSTATTLAFSRRSRDEPQLSQQYALAVVVACTVMLPRVIVAIAVINRPLALSLILPFTIMAVPGVLYAVWLHWLRKPGQSEGELARLRNPLGLATAIKFAVLYAVVAFLVKAAPELGLTEGLLPLSFVSGLTDMDAIALSLAQTRDETAMALATQAVVLAAISNTLLKTGLAVSLGSPGLRKRVAVVLGLTMLAGVVAMVLV